MDMDEQPEFKSYVVEVAGGFRVKVQAKSEDHAEGLAVGQIKGQLPAFIINGVNVKEE